MLNSDLLSQGTDFKMILSLFLFKIGLGYPTSFSLLIWILLIYQRLNSYIISLLILFTKSETCPYIIGIIVFTSNFFNLIIFMLVNTIYTLLVMSFYRYRSTGIPTLSLIIIAIRSNTKTFISTVKIVGRKVSLQINRTVKIFHKLRKIKNLLI